MSVLTSVILLTYINIWLPFGTVFKLSQGNIQLLLISLLCLFKIEPSRWKSDKGRRNEINNKMYVNLDWRGMLNIHHGEFIYNNSTFFYCQLLWSLVTQNVKLHKIFIKSLPSSYFQYSLQLIPEGEGSTNHFKDIYIYIYMERESFRII